MQNPSWLETRNFVMFLNIQLHSCQNSVFFHANAASEGMRGLKGFVVNFMIRMSRVSCNEIYPGIVMCMPLILHNMNCLVIQYLTIINFKKIF